VVVNSYNFDLVDVEAWNYSWSKYRYVDIYPENFIEFRKHFHNEILCRTHTTAFGKNWNSLLFGSKWRLDNDQIIQFTKFWWIKLWVVTAWVKEWWRH